MVLKPGALTDGARLISKMAAGGTGFEVCLGAGGTVQLVIADGSGTSTMTPSPGLTLDTAAYHYLAVAVDRDGQFAISVDGALGTGAAARPGSLDNGEAFTIGRRSGAAADFYQGHIDLIRIHRGRAYPAPNSRTTGRSSRAS